MIRLTIDLLIEGYQHLVPAAARQGKPVTVLAQEEPIATATEAVHLPQEGWQKNLPKPGSR
jgi:hypothetical protein